MTGFRFESPLWLLALLLVAALLWWRGKRSPVAAVKYPGRALLGPAVRATCFRPGAWLSGLRLLALALLVIALARPQIEKSETREDARGINIMLALDFSGTMRTRDFLLDGRRVTRSDGLKNLVAEFIRGRPQDRVGLVGFDRDAWLASPLTLDHEWLLERLKAERNGSGTAVGSGLAIAAEHLQKHTNETRVVVLVTDSENISAGPPPDEVAEALRPLGIRIHTIQLVSPEESWRRDDLSEYLSRASARTGGEYFRVRTGPDLRGVYGQIDRLEKHKLTDRKLKSYRELFPWLALPALGLVLLETLLAHTRWRRLP
jgi:Ca-activated chloride channel family protein